MLGYHLTSILYHAGAKVYLAGRSEANAEKAIKAIKANTQESSTAGQIQYLHLDLSDLSTIKASAEEFQSKETRLDILFNNAGVSLPPAGSTSRQGHELMVATNCLGPYLFTKLLLPALQAAAQAAKPGSTRIIWTSSIVVDLSAPKGGFDMADLTRVSEDQQKNYAISKTGNWFLASELARETAPYNILSITQNPGNLRTNLLRHAPKLMVVASYPLLHNARKGAYTELWAGLSPQLTMEHNGQYAIPWGRIHPGPRKDLLEALKGTDEGGTGRATEFREWCDGKIADFQ